MVVVVVVVVVFSVAPLVIRDHKTRATKAVVVVVGRELPRLGIWRDETAETQVVMVGRCWFSFFLRNTYKRRHDKKKDKDAKDVNVSQRPAPAGDKKRWWERTPPPHRVPCHVCGPLSYVPVYLYLHRHLNPRGGSTRAATRRSPHRA